MHLSIQIKEIKETYNEMPQPSIEPTEPLNLLDESLKRISRIK